MAVSGVDNILPRGYCVLLFVVAPSPSPSPRRLRRSQFFCSWKYAEFPIGQAFALEQSRSISKTRKTDKNAVKLICSTILDWSRQTWNIHAVATPNEDCLCCSPRLAVCKTLGMPSVLQAASYALAHK